MYSNGKTVTSPFSKTNQTFDECYKQGWWNDRSFPRMNGTFPTNAQNAFLKILERLVNEWNGTERELLEKNSLNRCKLGMHFKSGMCLDNLCMQ